MAAFLCQMNNSFSISSPHQLSVGFCRFFWRHIDVLSFHRAAVRAAEFRLVFHHPQVLRYHLQRVILITGDHLNVKLPFIDAGKQPPGGAGQIAGIMEVCAANASAMAPRAFGVGIQHRIKAVATSVGWLRLFVALTFAASSSCSTASIH